MLRRLALALLLVLGSLSALAANPPEGQWLLASVTGTGESALCILKITADGAKGVFFPGEGVEGEIKNFRKDGKQISFTVRQTRTVQGRQLTTEQTFVGTLEDGSDSIRGSLGDDRFLSRAKLSKTEKERFEASERFVRGPAVEPYTQATQLSNKAMQLSLQTQRERDEEKKKELQEQLRAARLEADEKVPGLFRKVLEEHADSPAALDAALALLRLGTKARLTPEEGKKVAAVVEKHARPFGPRFRRFQLTQAAELLGNHKDMEAVVLAMVEPLVKELPAEEKAAAQVRLLNLYRSGLEKANRPEDLKQVEARLAGLEKKLDEEYLASVPPFKPTKYAGRQKKDANQPVVFELFTGAQCPPCVAADVAFDAMEQAYDPKDVILVQYHMHIPGPDPLTNPDCIARWDYYKAKHPQSVRGTPTTLFNGTPAAGGGGGMANAEGKFKQYREVIDGLLENKSPISITGEAKRKGSVVEISAAVDGVQPEGEAIRLRFILVEDKVKYVGGNGLRFHHQVVRALPGGPEGFPIKENSLRKVTAVDLNMLRKGMSFYLDTYAQERPFPSKARPMDMEKLKVVVLVQNDETRQILQAAAFDVEGK